MIEHLVINAASLGDGGLAGPLLLIAAPWTAFWAVLLAASLPRARG